MPSDTSWEDLTGPKAFSWEEFKMSGTQTYKKPMWLLKQKRKNCQLKKKSINLSQIIILVFKTDLSMQTYKKDS